MIVIYFQLSERGTEKVIPVADQEVCNEKSHTQEYFPREIFSFFNREIFKYI